MSALGSFLGEEGLESGEIASIGLDNGRDNVADKGYQLDGEVDGGPDEHRDQYGRGKAALDLSRRVDEGYGFEEGDKVAHEGDKTPKGNRTELDVLFIS